MKAKEEVEGLIQGQDLSQQYIELEILGDITDLVDENNGSIAPKSILTKQKNSIKRQVSWTDLNAGLPLEKVYKIPGISEKEYRKSIKVSFRAGKSNFFFNVCCCITVGVLVFLVLAMTGILSMLFS